MRRQIGWALVRKDSDVAAELDGLLEVFQTRQQARNERDARLENVEKVVIMSIDEYEELLNTHAGEEDEEFVDEDEFEDDECPYSDDGCSCEDCDCDDEDRVG